MDALTSTTSWSLLLGLAMPWLVAMVNRPWWPTWARQWVAVGASVVGGLLVCLATDALSDVTDVLGACAIVLIASQAVYKRLFAESQARLEAVTSGRRQATVVDKIETTPEAVARPGRHHDLNGDGRPDR